MFTVCRLWWSASILLVLAGALPVSAQAPQPAAGARLGNYSQWRLALDGVSQPTEISAPEGFRVELLRSAQPAEGSWISLAWDAKGRLVVGREAQGLLRFDFTKGHKRIRSVVMVNNTVHEPRGLLFAHDSLYVSANNDRAIFRLRDLDGDGVYERVDEIRRLDGGVGHGRNGMALGPDGKIYLACGNNVRVPGDVAESSPHTGYGLDRLPPCDWNKFLFDADVTPPAGFIARFDEHGEQFELVAGGFRNPYDLAFNSSGDLFTYDADMEWDVGAPWYRPTTVMHVVPGGEYGWRQGSSVWPDAFPDCLPRVCDVGLGSPTGVVLGEKAKFPEKYKQALFVLDWAYGRILAVHLSPRGASYQGVVEPFIQGRPLNVTDATIGPDGALYFVVGGRRTQSALYRVTYTGETEGSSARGDKPDEAVAENRKLFQTLVNLPRGTEAAVQGAWPHLAHADPYVRQAARTAVGSSAPATWKERLVQETDGDRGAAGLLTLARAEEPHGALAALPDISRRLSQKSLSPSSRVALLRAAEIVLARHRASVGEKERAELRKSLEALAAAKNDQQPSVERQLLLELLVELQSPIAPKLGVAWLAAEDKPAEQLLWLHLLRNQQTGWNQELRGAYLAGLKRAEKFPGAQYLPRFVTYIRSDVMHSLSKSERETFAVELAELGVDDLSPVPLTVNRPLVKVWQLADLQHLSSEKPAAGAVERGAKLYRETLCIRCHRWNQEGGQVGPDLTNVAGRFGRRELLEAIVEPSRVVDEKYRTLVLSLKDGTLVSGVLVGGREGEIYVAPNHFLPAHYVRVREEEIAERGAATASLMPVGLLNSLSPAEVLDLLAFLESGLGLDLAGALKHNP